MSDSRVLLQRRSWIFLDVVDPHWAADFLPADDMHFSEMHFFHEDHAEMESKGGEKWNDLDLEMFDATVQSAN